MELKEVPRCQTEDPMQEKVARGLSKEEHAKRSYCRSRRRMSEGSEWMNRYIAGRFEHLAQSSQHEQSSSDHVHEAEQIEQYMGQQRLRRLKRIQGQQQE